jgi:hypothetical protein
MPDKWDPDAYRKRAEAWRQRAAQLPDGDAQQASCLALADQYEKLATLIEQRDNLIAPARDA